MYNIRAQQRQDLFEMLQKYSYKEGDFTLASGKKSNFFIDCKQTLLMAKGHHLASNLILDKLERWPTIIHAVAAVELGGCPLASAVSTLSYESVPIDALYIRKSVKDHGTQKLVEGGTQFILKQNYAKVILLEDTITTGSSSINALKILTEAGYMPTGVICVVDRLEGGSENIKAYLDIPVISLFTIKDFQNNVQTI